MEIMWAQVKVLCVVAGAGCSKVFLHNRRRYFVQTIAGREPA